MTETIKSKYARLVGELIARVPQEAQVSELNVYQEGIVSILPYIDTIIRDYLDPSSAIEGYENLEVLYDHAQRGESERSSSWNTIRTSTCRFSTIC